MTDADERIARYDGAVLLLPGNLRERARRLDRAQRERAEELRLRVGQPLTAVMPEGELELGDGRITRRDIELTVELATGASVHSAAGMLRRGYIACRGGYRIGLAGSVYTEGGAVAGFRSYAGAAIRIAREHRGIGDGLLPGLFRAGRFRSTLIAAPPGAGKTTLLRELVRLISVGGPDRPGLRVGLADERGEIAALREGEPQLDVGPRTDVLEGCPKAEAVMMLLRTMNPEVVALDEITAPEDVRAVEQARNCGTALLATAHAGGLEDLRGRPLYRPLLEGGVFENIIFIRREKGRRSYELRKGGTGLW